MADYYSLFSILIPLQSPEEVEWCREQLSIDDILSGCEEDNSGRLLLPEEAKQKYVLADHCAESNYLGFEYEIQESDRGELPSLWLYCHDSFDSESLIIFLMAFLKKFHPDGVISIGICHTCSRPIVNSYGGGAIVITADDVRSMSTGDWIYEQERELIGEGGGTKLNTEM